MDGRFRFLAGLDRILIIHKSSDIKSFPLESDGSTVFSIPQLIDATESAGIITAVLSFFQHLHTGSIYHMQLPGKLLPYLLSQTATASVITMKKAILCHIHFISAVTPTMPEHRALFAPFICMIESSQPPETQSADVGDPASSDIMAAAAAGAFSGFQAVCSGNMHIPAVTAAFPPGPAVFTFQFFYCHKFPETPACKVFCHRASPGTVLRNTSTVLYSPTHQMSGIYFYLISTITSAQPYNISVFPLIQFFQYRQMTKSLTFQFKSVCHPLSLTFRQKKRCGRNFSCRTAVRILLFIRFLFSSDKYCCQ